MATRACARVWRYRSHSGRPSMSDPLISIVVGVLNGARTLNACIDSIAKQEFRDFELLIKDGGSLDGTRTILERRNRDIAYWCSEPDRGLYHAWNSMIQRARGRWICFLGCDDQLADRGTLGRLAEVIRTEGQTADLICSLAAITDASGRFVKVLGRPWDFERLKVQQDVAHPGLLHRAELFERHGVFDTEYSIAGDYEFLLRLGPSVRTTFVDQITVRMGAYGMSHSRAHTVFRETWRAQARHRNIGRWRATSNLSVNYLKLAVKRAIGRR